MEYVWSVDFTVCIIIIIIFFLHANHVLVSRTLASPPSETPLIRLGPIPGQFPVFVMSYHNKSFEIHFTRIVYSQNLGELKALTEIHSRLRVVNS